VTVDPGSLARRWEGEARPGHFTAVATIVAKLFAIVRPDVAYFGEKDYQQLRIVERVVRDLDIPATIVGCPIVRERDGLAMSSRNTRLAPQDRTAALALCEALEAAARAVAWGETSGEVIQEAMAAEFAARPGIDLDYAALVDPQTLEPMSVVDRQARALVAGRIGSLRLIDNAPLVPCESEVTA
jgi:pantoate--beta-alanine ligase